MSWQARAMPDQVVVGLKVVGVGDAVAPSALGQPRARSHPHPHPRERAVATLKTWKVLTHLRCCPHRATTIVQTILVLHPIEEGRHSG
jgi:hypothetical protein